MSTCNHDCASCTQDCSERETIPTLQVNDFSSIKHTVAVASGKGGVGKSLLASLLAVEMTRRGYRCAILDADITGASICKIFGLKDKITGTEGGILPLKSKTGIKMLSLAGLLNDDTQPVLWRSPLIVGAMQQFYTEGLWGDIDYLFIDMPPGTGDMALTVFSQIPIDGIVVVSGVSELVSAIVQKVINMAKEVDVDVLALVENMSYLTCPNCNTPINVFGESHLDEVAAQYHISTTAKIPISHKLAAACDKGMIELFEGDWLDDVADMLEALPDSNAGA